MTLSKSTIFCFDTRFSHLVVLAPRGTEKGNIECLMSLMTKAKQYLLFSIAVISVAILNVYWLKFTGLQKPLTMCLVVVDMESYAVASGIVLLQFSIDYSL